MAKTGRWLGWHFLYAKKLSYRERSPLKAGKTYRETGALQLCHHGLHASPGALSAYDYVQGRYACRVELSGRIVGDSTKACATRRTVLGWCDLQILKNRGGETPEVEDARKTLAALTERLSAIIMQKHAGDSQIWIVRDQVEDVEQSLSSLKVDLEIASNHVEMDFESYVRDHKRKAERSDQAAHRILMAEIKRQGHYVKGKLA